MEKYNQIQNDFFHSALEKTNAFQDLNQVVSSLNNSQNLLVKRIDFQSMKNWYIDQDTSNIVHSTGKFFKIEGIQVKTNFYEISMWDQPIINQPEIGILGIIIKKFNGALYFLMQIKCEPGNINIAQIAPTVQATFSNYTQVHKGKKTLFLDYFFDPKIKTISDRLQSEQGARFFRKRNRNIIIEVESDLEIPDNYIWLTLYEIKQLLKIDNLVNMEARSILSSIVYKDESFEICTHFGKSILLSMKSLNGFYNEAEVNSWFVNLKTIYKLNTKLIPLSDIREWISSDDEIRHKTNKYFSVIAIDVQAGDREVMTWSQPLVKPSSIGIIGFLVKKINGVLHFLVQGRVEVGYIDIVELAPTVTTLNYSSLFAEFFFHADEKTIRFSTLLSEEGGRFYHAQNKYMIVELDDDENISLPTNFCWMTLAQIMMFLKWGNCISTEMRSLLTCLDIS